MFDENTRYMKPLQQHIIKYCHLSSTESRFLEYQCHQQACGAPDHGLCTCSAGKLVMHHNEQLVA